MNYNLVCFDLDDVIKPLVNPRWLDMIEAVEGVKLKYEDIHSFWDLSPYLHLLSPDVFNHEDGDPEYMAFDVIQRLINRDKQVFIVSATQPDNVASKSRWLQKYMPMIDSKNVIWTHKKWLLARPRRILVDDATHNLTAWKQCGGTSIAFTRPWNHDWDGLRVSTFSELEKILIKWEV